MLREALRSHESGPGAPRILFLTPRWGGWDETSWAMRQVAGALALWADVHVVSLQGRRPGVSHDGVFTVHKLGTLDQRAEAKRELARAALVRGQASEQAQGGFPHDDGSTLRSVYRSACERLGDPWEPAHRSMGLPYPDLIVAADCTQFGLIELLEAKYPDVPLLLVPLARRLSDVELSMFEPLLRRAACGVVFTEHERALLDKACGSVWPRFVGLPVSVNQSVQTEPNSFLGIDKRYVLVLAGTRSSDRQARQLIDLLRTGLAPHCVAVCWLDCFQVYEHAVAVHFLPAVERGSDLLRLIAWSAATIDLRPGGLIGLRSLQSLHFGVPIVVPDSSVPKEHAELGNAGLWFNGPAQMLWCAGTMFEDAVHDRMAAQAMSYARTKYGSTTQFTQRVASAVEASLNGGYEEYASA